MRILYYNWCPLQEPEGGGIALYQRNLLSYFEDNRSAYPDVEIYFLCSGFFYDGGKQSYIREEKQQYTARVFSLVNSPVYAPMRAPEENFVTMLDDESLNPVIKDFLDTHGPFDVIHFQTLEGLSLKVLEAVPKSTKLFYSVHNYTAICPNVMLWTEEETNCEAVPGDCGRCMARYNRPSIGILKNSRRLLEKEYHKLYYLTRGVKFVSRKFAPVKKRQDNPIYNRYVTESVKSLNAHMTTVLAVSDRVRVIMQHHGMKNVRTCYIGTRFADRAAGKALTGHFTNPFGIVYMGYMRAEKGFYFLLKALERLGDEQAKHISVTFATKVTDYRALKRVEALKIKFDSVRLFDGYTHDQIPEILSGAHLGIVPVLWEDNLPQVAIEMVASGVPVLASSFGGASELNENVAFRFRGGDEEDFIRRLGAILENRDLLKEYWQYQKQLTTMDQHVEELMELYQVP